ncbi:hypothetical protein DSO57_1022525 [Entomophthora muscae]|uniref:Uncharacterized protein n=1 Tax=Entomophthora muscae TaxID=34485 RepID=A0ACC2RUB5_9FUNG|nr:hypothetical protein DSO57_1022525 [Entomophthora muscae]
MKDVLINCLTIGSVFSACGGWGRLVNKGNLCLPLCGWTGMSYNSQLAWCQMLVALAFVCNQIGKDEYKLVAPLVPLSASKRPCSTPSCHSILHIPTGSALSTVCALCQIHVCYGRAPSHLLGTLGEGPVGRYLFSWLLISFANALE